MTNTMFNILGNSFQVATFQGGTPAQARRPEAPKAVKQPQPEPRASRRAAYPRVQWKKAAVAGF